MNTTQAARYKNREEHENLLDQAIQLRAQGYRLQFILRLTQASLHSFPVVIVGLAVSIVSIAIFSSMFILAARTPGAMRDCLKNPGSSEQGAYQCAIIQDRNSLQPGYVSFQGSIRIPLGQPYTLVVTACGSQSPACRKSHLSAGAASPEPSQLQGKVQVGAYLNATLISDMPMQDMPRILDTQPVISPSDSATWYWNITPSQPGIFKLLLTVTPLLTNTNTPLTDGVSFPIKVMVTANTQQRVATFFDSARGKIASLAGILGLFGLTIASVTAWCYKRIRRMDASKSRPTLRESRETNTQDSANSTDADHGNEEDR